jgi:hypothetical protein
MRYSSPPISAFPYDLVRLFCEQCGRRGKYRKETLIARHGPTSSGPIYWVAVANYPRHKHLGEQRCGILRGPVAYEFVLNFSDPDRN